MPSAFGARESERLQAGACLYTFGLSDSNFVARATKSKGATLVQNCVDLLQNGPGLAPIGAQSDLKSAVSGNSNFVARATKSRGATFVQNGIELLQNGPGLAPTTAP